MMTLGGVIHIGEPKEVKWCNIRLGKEQLKAVEHLPPSKKRRQMARCKSISPVYGTTLHTSG